MSWENIHKSADWRGEILNVGICALDMGNFEIYDGWVLITHEKIFFINSFSWRIYEHKNKIFSENVE